LTTADGKRILIVVAGTTPGTGIQPIYDVGAGDS
jgi:hypothetical protein